MREGVGVYIKVVAVVEMCDVSLKRWRRLVISRMDELTLINFDGHAGSFADGQDEFSSFSVEILVFSPPPPPVLRPHVQGLCQRVIRNFGPNLSLGPLWVLPTLGLHIIDGWMGFSGGLLRSHVIFF